MQIDRRQFLRHGALLPAAVAGAPAAAPRTLPPPHASGIDHIVVVMLENRSFDHLLGWLWTADGRQAGLTFVDAQNIAHATYALRPDYKGCGHPDPDHDYLPARIQYNRGRMDGFLRSPSNDPFAIGYYGPFDIPFHAALACHYTTLDRYFCSILGPTFPNRIFQHAAQTDRLTDSLTLATMPTIWDRLLAAGVDARYYYSNVPVLALWGSKYLGIAAPIAEFFQDAAAGMLPSVSFVDPQFAVLEDSLADDDHPHADIRRGDAFLALVFEALSRGPGWPGTVAILNFDEWGGFFDHVPPPRAVAPNLVDPDIVGGRTLLGFRVPVVVASPFTRGTALFPRVNHLVFDHTSVLKLIEWRWGLAPLTARDAFGDVANLAYALRFDEPDIDVPPLPLPAAPPPAACSATAPASTARSSVWLRLAESRRVDGWPLQPSPQR